MRLHLEFEQEVDGSWICEVEELNGVVSYGATLELARHNAIVLALVVIANRLAAHEMPDPAEIVFV